MDYDVLFIGSGQGAWNGAIPMSQAGLKVCVVEEGQFGGTCTNRGCNAKITLDRPIELLQQVKQLKGKGFDAIPTINWPDLMAHKHEVIDGLAFSNEQKLSTAGVAIIKGHATFIDDHTLQIADQTVTADKIVIVSGQRPHRLDIPGRELMHDSTDFLVIPEMPQHLTIIGGGYVGMEFASIANAAGAQVTVILRGHQPLKDFYQPHVTQLIATMRAAGITFNYDVNIQAVTQNKNGLTLHGANGFTLDTDYIIDATGRIPNTEALNLDKIGIHYDAHGIQVNDYLQTNIDHIYATGDVVAKSQPKITPVAIFESQYLAHQFTNETSEPINYPAIATTVFTMPRISQVGINIAAAKQDSRYTIENFDYTNDWYRQVGNDNAGSLILAFDEKNHLVGASEYSNDAVNTINGLVDMIELGVDHERVERLIYTFPSNQHSYFRKI